MRATRFLLVIGLAGLAASCGWVSAHSAKRLADGCYYAGGRAVFRIEGDRGRVLIPGNVTDFAVRRERTWSGAAATFEPAFLFDGYERAPSVVEAWDDRRAFTFPMKGGTQVPTVVMNWSAHGNSDVALGPSC